MNATIERLSKLENFQQWTFEAAASMEEVRSGENRRYPIKLDGPWRDEPDKVQWIDPDTNLDCMVLRNHFGAWCGYVGVPDGHPFFGKGYGECLEGCGEPYCSHGLDSRLTVHGGVTFAGACSESEKADTICHVAAPGRPEVWWLGFDCAHAFDLAPGLVSLEMDMGFDKPPSGDVYRDLAYAVDEVTSLARQLAKYGR